MKISLLIYSGCSAHVTPYNMNLDTDPSVLGYRWMTKAQVTFLFQSVLPIPNSDIYVLVCNYGRWGREPSPVEQPPQPSWQQFICFSPNLSHDCFLEYMWCKFVEKKTIFFQHRSPKTKALKDETLVYWLLMIQAQKISVYDGV